MRTKPTAAILAALTSLVACYDEQPMAVEDERSAIDAPTQEFAAAYDDGGSFDNFRHRVSFTVDVLGGLEPHETVTVTIEGTVNDKLVDGRVRVRLPTMASMSHAGAGNRPSYPVGKDFPLVEKWTLPAMDEGSTWKQSFRLKLPDKGYYHVAIEADLQGPDDKEDQYVIDDIDEQAWLFVTDDGGFVTSHFDETVFGDNLVPQPGPFQTRRLTGTGGAVAGDMVAGDSDDDPITIHAIYYRYGNKNAKDAEVKARYISQSDSRGYTVTRTVPTNGKVLFDCPDDFEWILASIVVPTTNEINADYTIGYAELDHTDCGDEVQVVALATHYVPWNHLREVIPRIDNYFNKYRKRVNWRVRLDQEYTSYNRNTDIITFNSYGWSGRLTAGHEYGHALHNKAIGGTWWARHCDDHEVDEPSSYKCAFKEGFADYAGWVGENNPEHWENKRYDSDDGAPGEIEGNIAALFHDLIDSNNEGDDETTYSADYVTDVLKTCRVNGSGKRDDVADFVWCLENRVNENVHDENFPGLSSPNNVSESATEPSDWSPSDIRSTWLKSLKR